VALLYESASRASAVLALNVEDLDLPNKQAKISAKGGVTARPVRRRPAAAPTPPPRGHHLGEANVSANVVMTKTGHKSLRSVQRYVKPGLAAVHEATEALSSPRRRS
jgi:hypothetical protein